MLIVRLVPLPAGFAAVLESGAFGSWIPPDYKALLAANPVEYAAMRAAASGSGGAATSPVAAALPPPPRAKKQDEDEKADEHEHKEGEESDEDKVLPSTPAAERKESGSEIVDDEKAAAIAAALASPPPTPAQIAVEKRVADWLERVLLPAVNRQASTEPAWQVVCSVRQTHRCNQHVVIVH